MRQSLFRRHATRGLEGDETQGAPLDRFVSCVDVMVSAAEAWTRTHPPAPRAVRRIRRGSATEERATAGPTMMLRRRLARWGIDAWRRVRARPIGRAARWVVRHADDLLYPVWYGMTWIGTRRPRTLNAKVRYKMVRDRRPILAVYADKVAVRDYVGDRVGEDLLPRLLQVADTPDALRWDDLPHTFACKVTHASGGTMLVMEQAQRDAGLPSGLPLGHGRVAVHPDAFDRSRAEEILSVWLDRRYGWSGWKREWAYTRVQPRILVEELLSDADGNVPADYKFFVFHGTCRFIQVDSARFGDHHRDLMTPTWDRLDVDYNYPRSARIPDAPPRLDDMLRIAETLADGEDFLRVDLYAIENRIVFGELTVYPASGHGSLRPPSFDLVLGSWWTVPPRYR